MTTQEIELMMRQLLVLAQAANKGKIRSGYYAVDVGDGLKRYRLDAPAQGYWAGWHFLKTGSDYWEQRPMLKLKPDGTFADRTTDHAKAVWAAIVADPVQAMLNYSDITGVCGVCGRKLEDPTSVALGIGPVCLKRMIEV